MDLDLRERDGRVLVSIRVQPRASRTGVVGVCDGVLRVRLAAPPVDGAANQALVKYLAREVFGVSRRDVELVVGRTGRDKVVAVSGIGLEAVRAAVLAALE